LSAPLGPRHQRVKRLRALIRDPKARRAEGVFVIEGPRLLDAALEHHVSLESFYLAPGAERGFAPLAARLRASGAPEEGLKEGVLERIGDTVTPQPILAVARIPIASLDDLSASDAARARPVVVAVDVQDPGNAGTIVRSAEAAGAAGVVFSGNSVDPFAPKVVRSTAGAIFGIPIVEADDPVNVLDALGARGRRRLGTVAAGGAPIDDVDLTGPVALVVGNEAHGLPDAVLPALDATVTIPIELAAESLNVAMATTVLLFEAARQRREQP
jgi:TrmH family RNA methyltransferase